MGSLGEKGSGAFAATMGANGFPTRSLFFRLL